ncbi:solute carrier family 26 member 6 isoform X2 [Misgurnus anguillicaudatus]|uniref:solute carrier family 26 member 6 isoform X2 n=1 Tax=Misgurnus anguillicaudatus TaxID=75329 RepID=UPI003CCFB397
MSVSGAKFCVDRIILDQINLDELAQWQDEIQGPSLKEKIRDSMRCSVRCIWIWIITWIPVLSWIPSYSIRENALGDLVSGVSVGIMHLPQGMAYALLASVPPVFGLYTSFYPVLVYFIFGTSRHISIGTFAVISLMIGSVSERLAPDDHFLINGTNGSIIVDTEVRDELRVKVAATTTVLCGIFQVLLGLVRFGFVVTYLSEPLVRGYTTGAATHVIISQLKYMFGVSPRRFTGPLQLIYTLLDLGSLLPQTHVPTLMVTLVSLIVLIIVKEINSCYSHKLPLPIPVELMVIIAGTLISHYIGLRDVNGVDVVGEIPNGLAPPTIPEISFFSSIVGDAFAVAVVGYAINISLGKTFALKHGYKVDSNQEFVALGLSNTIGGLFQCYAVTSSMSRSLVQESTGGKTQLVWLVTFLCTVLLNLDLGLVASIAFSLLTVIFRTQRPQYSLLGRVPGTELYLETESYKEAKEITGITIFRSSGMIYYANAELYQEALLEKSGINFPKLRKLKKMREKQAKKTRKRQMNEEDKQSGVLRELANRMVISMKNMSDFARARRHETDRECIIDEYGISTVDMDQDFQPEQISGKMDKHSIILDFSTVSFIDTVTLKTLTNIFRDFAEVDITVYIAGCQGCVVQQLERGRFFTDSVTKNRLFPSIHDAVLHCLSQSRRDLPTSEVTLEMPGATRL